mmetsp:Transcript_29628/g.96826  ORF Transcript_29628/g.96826 Transcript_29628/m.96826 type:complete len:380 (-) Transcript_29628:646-1785(-)
MSSQHFGRHERRDHRLQPQHFPAVQQVDHGPGQRSRAAAAAAAAAADAAAAHPRACAGTQAIAASLRQDAPQRSVPPPAGHGGGATGGLPHRVAECVHRHVLRHQRIHPMVQTRPLRKQRRGQPAHSVPQPVRMQHARQQLPPTARAAPHAVLGLQPLGAALRMPRLHATARELDRKLAARRRPQAEQRRLPLRRCQRGRDVGHGQLEPRHPRPRARCERPQQVAQPPARALALHRRLLLRALHRRRRGAGTTTAAHAAAGGTGHALVRARHLRPELAGRQLQQLMQQLHGRSVLLRVRSWLRVQLAGRCQQLRQRAHSGAVEGALHLGQRLQRRLRRPPVVPVRACVPVQRAPHRAACLRVGIRRRQHWHQAQQQHAP